LPSLAGRKLHQQSFIADATVPAEPDHGTAIAALLVGRADTAHPEFGGLLPSAEIYAAGVFEKRGQQTAANAVSIAAALDWMVSNRVPVVNVSLSGGANALVKLAVGRAAESGTTLIAAAGNGGPSAPPAYPGALSDVIAVTAVDQNEAIFPQANRGDYIAFAAPGVRIWTPTMEMIGQYHTGTSFATPFVAAAAAIELMTGAPPEPRELRRRLAAYALHLGGPGHNSIYGYGLIRAAKSCTKIASTR
jgi:subtilisin family serine protease